MIGLFLCYDESAIFFKLDYYRNINRKCGIIPGHKSREMWTTDKTMDYLGHT